LNPLLYIFVSARWVSRYTGTDVSRSESIDSDPKLKSTLSHVGNSAVASDKEGEQLGWVTLNGEVGTWHAFTRVGHNRTSLFKEFL
jgi:hypothetical protein